MLIIASSPASAWIPSGITLSFISENKRAWVDKSIPSSCETNLDYIGLSCIPKTAPS